jgi:predicted DCC family thiol-disulfide oxidoreductase YuxK
VKFPDPPVKFVNYFGDPTRETAVNGAVARALLGAYLVWKTVWYDWHAVLSVPYVGVEEYAFLMPESPTVLVVEKWLLIVALGCFVAGYRLRLTSFASALLLGHLAGVRFVYNTSGGVTALFIGVYFLVLFGVFSHTQDLTVDAARRYSPGSLDELVSRLKSTPQRGYRMDALKWCLVVLAVVYFGGGYDKLFPGFRLHWAAPDNLSRIILIQHTLHGQPVDLGMWMLEFPRLVGISAALTLALEVGFLFAVLLGIGITPFVLGLYGMHVVVVASMGIVFGDAMVFLALFFSWDALHERLASDRQLDLVFDERCLFCARSLYPFKLLDTEETVSFYSQSDVPETYRGREGVDFEQAMYVFDGDQAYEGYYAFRELLRQHRVFSPLVAVMGLPVVRQAGERVYRYVADNRSRYFTCSVDLNP